MGYVEHEPSRRLQSHEAPVVVADAPSRSDRRGYQGLQDICQNVGVHRNRSKIAVGRIDVLVTHEHLNDE
jgi:hypothetical protein